MNKTTSFYLKFGLCTVVAAVLALTSHIYISTWAQSFLQQIMAGSPPSTAQEGYSIFIMGAAYSTALLSVGILAFIYYQAGHLLPFSNPFLKSLLLAAILFGIRGDGLRQAIMDYLYGLSLGVKSPLLTMALTHIDQWVATLILAFSFVYLCPTKKSC